MIICSYLKHSFISCIDGRIFLIQPFLKNNNFSVLLRLVALGISFEKRSVEVFLYNMKMLIPVWREIGMGKIPHSSLMAHSKFSTLGSAVVMN